MTDDRANGDAPDQSGADGDPGPGETTDADGDPVPEGVTGTEADDGTGAPEAGDPSATDDGRGGDDEAGEDEGNGTADDDGPVDFAWVMQATFVTTIVVGAPLVAVLSAFVGLPTWESRVGFAARVGAVVWILTALALYGYERWVR